MVIGKMQRIIIKAIVFHPTYSAISVLPMPFIASPTNRKCSKKLFINRIFANPGLYILGNTLHPTWCCLLER